MIRAAAALLALALTACAQGGAAPASRVPDSLPPSLGVPDDAMTMQIYRLGASNQNPSAQFGIGVLYEKGRDFPHDFDEAARWYRKSAEQGYPEAAYNLGLLYAKGMLGKPDPVEAAAWFSRAATSLPPDQRPRAEKALSLERAVMTDAERAELQARLRK